MTAPSTVDIRNEAAGVLDAVATVVVGRQRTLRLALAAVLAGGHVLFEDVPGTAKTVLARTIAQSIEGSRAARIQCTPDLQPTRDPMGLPSGGLPCRPQASATPAPHPPPATRHVYHNADGREREEMSAGRPSRLVAGG